MVVLNGFQDIFDAVTQIPALSLPTFKESKIKINFEKNDDNKNIYNGIKPPLPFASSEVFLAIISNWRRLTAVDEDCKAVYEITFDVTGSNFTFKAGDTIGVIPRNYESEVNFILDHLDLIQADLTYTLCTNNQKGSKIPTHIPLKSTLRYCLTHCVELRSVLKKLFLLTLSRYTKDENERKVLEYLCSKEGSNAYQTHILNRRLCLLDLFQTFKSCKPPIEVVLANLPRLLPRPYSIANSGLKDAGRLRICFSVMPLENKRKGLTTGWLESIILNKEMDLENRIKSLSITSECYTSPCNKVPIYMRKNVYEFSLPENLETPLLLIGPGTGVSPFIGFLEERQFLRNNNNINLGNVWLFFGCRNPKLDFIYEKELMEFLSNGTLNKLSTAFSRVENGNVRYIQDSLIQNGKDVINFIKDGAFILICGDLNSMATQIKETLLKCLVLYDNRSKEEADKFLCDMQKEKRYFVDVWS